ncbi:hypothetical protein ABT117_38605 [Streptomyces sp. NPDC002262]|uniref:hypothetical protein n=1 Tax=Streptomyces sp. NPDC002262 TaxID=3154414 RepID=UPI003329887A
MNPRTALLGAVATAATALLLSAPTATASQQVTFVSYTGTGTTRQAATADAQARFASSWPAEWSYCEVGAINEVANWAGTGWWTSLNARCYR